MSLLIKTQTGCPTFVGETISRDQAAEAERELVARSIERLRGDNRWRAIVCLHGRVWITQEHDLKDYVLEPGEIFLVTRSGTVVIQALGDACVDITPSLTGTPCVKRFADTIFP